MSTTIHVPVENGRFSAQFPRKCVYCGQTATTHLTISGYHSDTTSQQRGNVIRTTNRSLSVELPVPYCSEHAQRSDQYDQLLRRVGIVGGLLGLAVWCLLYFTGALSGYTQLLQGVLFIGSMPIGWVLLVFITKQVRGRREPALRDYYSFGLLGGRLGIKLAIPRK